MFSEWSSVSGTQNLHEESLAMRYARGMRFLACGALTLLVALVAPERAPAAESCGASIELTSETPLTEVVAHPERVGDEPVLIRGKVAEVCQRKGCWTILRDGSASIRVRFKDYGFFVPTDCSGREALVEGVVEVRTLSPDLARHYEEETVDGDPGAVTGPRREVSMTASGVRLLP